MRAVIEGWHRLRSLWRREALERRIQEEIRFHVERETEKNVRSGLAPDEAWRQALVAFGGTELTRERVRDEYGAGLLEDLVRDLRFHPLS